jgi:hypothetical protein
VRGRERERAIRGSGLAGKRGDEPSEASHGGGEEKSWATCGRGSRPEEEKRKEQAGLS